jgi:hypothetical protein
MRRYTFTAELHGPLKCKLARTREKCRGSAQPAGGALFVLVRFSDNRGIAVFVLFVLFVVFLLLFIIVIVRISRRQGVADEA